MWYVPSRLLSGILDASWHATFLAVMVILFQLVMRKRLPARWRFALWLLVLVRLSGVALPESRLSVFNWVPRSPVVVLGSQPLPPVVPYTRPGGRLVMKGPMEVESWDEASGGFKTQVLPHGLTLPPKNGIVGERPVRI